MENFRTVEVWRLRSRRGDATTRILRSDEKLRISGKKVVPLR